MLTIILNGRPVSTSRKAATYDEVLDLAGAKTDCTVAYFKRLPDGRRVDGTLVRGQSLELVEGMIVNVVNTGNA